MRQEDADAARKLIRGVLRAKKAEKLKGDYEGLEPADDGRIRTSLGIDGTGTGRLNSSSFFLADPGSANLQNLAKTQAKRDPLFQIREVMCPTPGKALGSSDLSSAERRLLAYLADAEQAIEWTERGDEELGDTSYPYKKFGEQFFDDVDNWRQVTDSKYAVSKMAMLALDRGVGWRRLKQQINKDAEIHGATISAKQAKDAHALFHDLFPGYREYYDRMADFIREHDYVTNVLGRRHICFSRRNKRSRLESLAKDMVSFQAQAVGDLLNQRLRWMYEDLDPNLLQIVLQIHDEVLFEFDPRDMHEVRRKTLHLMEQPVSLERARPKTPHEEITIPAEFEMSTSSWADLHAI